MLFVLKCFTIKKILIYFIYSVWEFLLLQIWLILWKKNPTSCSTWTPKVLWAWLPESIIMFYRHVSLFNCRGSPHHNTSYLGYNTHDCDSKVVLVSYNYIYLFLFSHSLKNTSFISLFISCLLASMSPVSHKSITY